MISWSDADFLEKIAKFVPYILISLGFLIAFSGQFLKTKIEARITDLREIESINFKNTRPEIEPARNCGRPNFLRGKSER